ncbi:DUF5994 family protein [Mycolicibacterium confluentis]|uniref:Uncharacterized protein n=1 Tax=Mycolicibacterium confluentis TaxID=28047 RepID=A0A7I7XT17_9MYCO|nr:DUF5994 family protein [Mycolicibacterium confluentis]MCV7321134.1 hypothetical protein [Mycolicibacterium confluentis]ORV21269.1 hypothetical protein AWB99_27080 [Mycolicibacterium confluentis]BBZ32390.1 hypothetical protein MCNF_09950 [Mycolicibacterium confluentis]
MTLTNTHRHEPNFTGPERTPRLRLKPKEASSGTVDGAWWPRSDDLSAELPDLLAVLSVRLGDIERVQYALPEWKSVPRTINTGAARVKLDGYQRQPHCTVGILGQGRQKLTLLVVPPYTDASDAHTAMMKAAEPHGTGTADELLGIGPRDRARRDGYTLAENRWESEGGAPCRAPAMATSST